VRGVCWESEELYLIRSACALSATAKGFALTEKEVWSALSSYLSVNSDKRNGRDGEAQRGAQHAEEGGRTSTIERLGMYGTYADGGWRGED